MDESWDGAFGSNQQAIDVAKDDMGESLPEVQSESAHQRDGRVLLPGPRKEEGQEAEEIQGEYECCYILQRAPSPRTQGTYELGLTCVTPSFLGRPGDAVTLAGARRRGSCPVPDLIPSYTWQVWWNLEKFSNVLVRVPEDSDKAEIIMQNPLWKTATEPQQAPSEERHDEDGKK